VVTSSGDAEVVDVGQTDGRYLGRGRIFAADVVPAVTVTFGGIEVDDAGVVIDGNREPIHGLYAVGADMSDAYHQG
jgi:hypothetical protein